MAICGVRSRNLAYGASLRASAAALADAGRAGAAKLEGNSLTIYASMNEEEAPPYWALFETATGIKVDFLRMSDPV